jgi:hypothetical protein
MKNRPTENKAFWIIEKKDRSISWAAAPVSTKASENSTVKATKPGTEENSKDHYE